VNSREGEPERCERSLARSCTSLVTTAKLVELGYEVLTNPPYSPGLAPNDLFLFSSLKKSLAEQKFGSNEEVIAATEAYFADLQKTLFFCFFQTG